MWVGAGEGPHACGMSGSARVGCQAQPSPSLHGTWLLQASQPPVCLQNPSPLAALLFQALCINEAVLRLQSAPLINERCLELQKGGGSGGATSRKAAAVAGTGGERDTAAPQRRVGSLNCCLW